MARIRVIPVIDLMNGVVVRGIAGRRHEYRPLVSRLTSSCDAIDVARAFGQELGFSELYVADLDAIRGDRPALQSFHRLERLGIQLWVDAGVQTPNDAQPLIQAGVDRVVVGLETVAGPEVVAQLCAQHGDRVVFSLDLKDGELFCGSRNWKCSDPFSVAAEAISFGVRFVIILDLVKVGMNGGTGTEDLCRRLAAAYPQVEIIAGGGVRGRNDLIQLQDCGVRAVLVASALHDGRLSAKDLRSLLDVQ